MSPRSLASNRKWGGILEFIPQSLAETLPSIFLSEQPMLNGNFLINIELGSRKVGANIRGDFRGSRHSTSR